MKTADIEMNDELRDEYDLTQLRVRKLGPGRKNFNGIDVHLEPDVAELFPDSQLEFSALLAMGVWGWRQSEGWFRFVLALGIPILVAVVWGTFAVPNDPSRSGAAPIAVPGMLRLAIELAVFVLAIWALCDLRYTRLRWILGSIIAMHYMTSYDRILWLIAQ